MYQVSIDQIAKEMGLTYLGPSNRTIRNIAFDSREISQGDLFVAIRGQRVDGHRFIEQAIQSGAAAVAVDAEHAFESDTTGCLMLTMDRRLFRRLASGVAPNSRDRSLPLLAVREKQARRIYWHKYVLVLIKLW